MQVSMNDQHDLCTAMRSAPGFARRKRVSRGTWRETVTHYAVSWHGGYAEIERSGAGRPVAFWPIHPQRIQIQRKPSGEIFYLVEGAEGYSSMRPFLEGDGYHTWTLYTTGDNIPVVPLVP